MKCTQWKYWKKHFSLSVAVVAAAACLSTFTLIKGFLSLIALFVLLQTGQVYSVKISKRYCVCMPCILLCAVHCGYSSHASSNSPLFNNISVTRKFYLLEYGCSMPPYIWVQGSTRWVIDTLMNYTNGGIMGEVFLYQWSQKTQERNE